MHQEHKATIGETHGKLRGTSDFNLNSRVSFMHELKQLVHNSFQELPVSPQKTWVLSNYIPAPQIKRNIRKKSRPKKYHIFVYRSINYTNR